MIQRRSFLALAATAAAEAGCEIAAPPAAPPAPRGATPSPAPHADLEEATIAGLTGRMARGEITAAEILNRYLTRIAAIDRDGARLRSVIEIDRDAPEIAAERDDERKRNRVRGPLHGVPLLLKDNIDTADRMSTTAGSPALAGAPAPRDAHLVTRLREAGAVIFGKTNMSEWANMRSMRSTSGWSGRGGLTKNPYALDRNPSGSSSGSAVAVSANLAAAAIGTETDGSIVSPASICGIVGLKPTVGLVSRAGIVPISRTQDTAGPMTRTVADAALILGVMAGHDPGDPATAGARPRVDYTSALDPGGARGRRIGVVRSNLRIPRSVNAIFADALDDLRRIGAVIVDPVDIGPIGKLEDAEMVVLLYELKADMARYLAERRPASGVRTLDDLLRWNVAHAAEELAFFGQELFEQAAAKGGLDAPEYREALAACKRLSRDEGIDLALQRHGVDVLVAPTGGPAWMSDLVNGDAFTGTSSTPAAVAGYPSITVPAGALHGLPIGISFFAGAYSEQTLLRVAYAFEQATKRRARPRFLATVDLAG